MQYTRLVVVGDSFSEGMSDEIINGQYRGWADRVADVMAATHPEFSYINLAIRGKTLSQVITDQLPLAKPHVTGKETLFSFHAGANDVIRPRYQAELTYSLYNKGAREAAATGATLVLFCVYEGVGGSKRGKIWSQRFAGFNRNVRAIGEEVGAIVLDPNGDDFWSDSRLMAFDRLHLNSEGHFRIAQAFLEKFNFNFDPNWRRPFPPAEPESKIVRSAIAVAWILTFALPWAWRRLRGTSSGDGRSAKYPTPINWPL